LRDALPNITTPINLKSKDLFKGFFNIG